MKTNFEKFWDEHYEHLIADGCNKEMAYFIWLSALHSRENSSPESGETTQEKGRPFEVGDNVIHTYFGKGVVTVDDGGEVAPLGVTFDEGGFIWHSRRGFDNLLRGHITHLD